jgi:hypothetical protein
MMMPHFRRRTWLPYDDNTAELALPLPNHALSFGFSFFFFPCLTIKDLKYW